MRQIGIGIAILISVILGFPAQALAEGRVPTVGDGNWNLAASISVNVPADQNCSFLSGIGDSSIPVTQTASQLSANDVDTNGTAFALNGSVRRSGAIRFTIAGFGITPGTGGCTIASRNHNATYSGRADDLFGPTLSLSGRVRGSADYAFEEDEDGNPIFQTVTWSGTFTLLVQNSLSGANQLMLGTMEDFQASKATGGGEYNWTDDGCSIPAPVLLRLKREHGEDFDKDRPFGFNFLPACQRHDFAYRNYAPSSDLQLDPRPTRRTTANVIFVGDLSNVCADEPEDRQDECRETAAQYGRFVFRFSRLVWR